MSFQTKPLGNRCPLRCEVLDMDSPHPEGKDFNWTAVSGRSRLPFQKIRLLDNWPLCPWTTRPKLSSIKWWRWHSISNQTLKCGHSKT